MRLMWTGLIGFVIGLIALIICLLLPVIAGPNVSWGEAMFGILPAGGLTLVFLVLMLVGMASAMSHRDSGGRRRRRDDDEDDDDEDRPRRRSRREYNDDEFDDDPPPRRRR